MSENSLPDNGGGDAGSANADLPANQPNPSADEHKDAGSGGDAGAGQGEPKNNAPQEGSPQEKGSSSDDDDGLAKFAESRGYKWDEMSDDAKALLKDVQENQRAYRKTKEEAEALRKATTEVTTVTDEELEDEDDPVLAELKRTQSRMAQYESKQQVTDFYLRNPEARDYDKEMGEIVLEEAKKNGKDAARYLASDINRLYILAKARRGGSADVEAARREERELLRHRQEAGSEGAAASSPSTKTQKVTREWLQSGNYDPSNPEHRKMVDEAMARGDLYG